MVGASSEGAMSEQDDRLAGDPIWELFAHAAPGPEHGAARHLRHGRWLAVAGLIVLGWLVFPPLAVVIVCLSVPARDVCTGRRLARSIPDKAGGTICARFAYAWGAWKLGAASFALLLALAPLFASARGGREVPPALMVSLFASELLWIGGFFLSAALTASGLMAAYRSGMRVWIGEGVNRARTLFMGMLMVGFLFVVLGPICVWVVGQFPRPKESQPGDIWGLLPLFSCIIGGPVVILLALDWISRRVIADRPGKFGPKVPTVGKWNSERDVDHRLASHVSDEL
jgi:hypothetical protein